jgi:hypothetical protein
MVRSDGGLGYYVVPLSELAGVNALLQRGAAWARSNKVPLPDALAARLADVEATVGAAKAAAASGNGRKGPTGCGASDLGTSKNGTSGRLGAMFLSVSEVAVLSGLKPRRLRQLAGSELPGRRTSAGWMLAAEDVDRWLANRRGQ